MSIRKRGPAGALLDASPKTLGTIYLGEKYAKVLGFQARNYADATKQAAGSDAAVKVSLTDADGIVFYLDAADRDYKTALKNYFIEQDDTNTGLDVIPVDATGAAVAAGQQVENVIARSPVTVKVTNGGTATDYFELYLFVELSGNVARVAV